MQFTVIIEFLIPGLATLLLGLALLPSGALPPPPLPAGTPTNETATALLLLAVSYPVGHLVNFPVYVLLQSGLISPYARRRIIKDYSARGINLPTLAGRPPGFSGTRKELSELSSHMRAVVFGRNIERLNSNHAYHEGLQRLSRGMLLPLLMAIVLVCRQHGPAWLSLAILLGSFLLILVALLIHSIQREETQIAQFFVVASAEQCDTSV